MANVAEGLAIEMTANSAPLLREFSKASKNIESEMKKIEKNLANSQKKMDSFFSKKYNTSGIDGLFSKVASALAVAEIGKLANAYQNVENRLKSMGVPATQVGAKLSEITAIAQRSYGSFTGVSDLYTKLSLSAANLGINQAETARITETVSKALVLSGAGAQQAEAAILQLSQAMASGKLQGDEYRSLMENAPVLMNRLAAAMGITQAQMREMSKEGDLTADKIVTAFSAMATGIDRDFSKITPTVAQSFNVLTAAATDYVGKSQAVIGTTTLLSQGVIALSKNMDTLAFGASALGVILISRFAAPAVALGFANMAKSLALLAPALTATAATAGTAGVAIAGFGVAARGALAFLGGPIGIAIAAGVTALGYFISKTGEAKVSTDAYNATLSEATRTNYTFAESAAAAAESPRMLSKVQGDLKNSTDSLAAAEEKLKIELAALIEMADYSGDLKLKDALEVVTQKLNGTQQGVIDAAREIDSLNAMNPSFGGILAGLDSVKAKALGVIQSIIALKAEAANAGSVDEAARRGVKLEYPTSAPIVGGETAGFAARENRSSGKSKQVQELESESSAVLKRAKDSGVLLGAYQAEAIARNNLLAEASAGGGGGKKGSGGGGGGGESDFQKLMDNLEKERVAIGAEANAIGLLNAEKRASIEIDKLGIASDSVQAQQIREKTAAIEESKNKLKEFNETNQQIREFGSAVSGALEDIILNGKKANEVFKGLVKTLASSALQRLLNGSGGNPSGGSGGLIGGIFNMFSGIKFANGGGMSSGGSMPLKTYSRGGVANSPQLAIFGEGRMNEAYVPLPDGRSIPVTMRMPSLAGVGGGNFNSNTQMSINVDVSGARGNLEIMEMVRQGVGAALPPAFAQYDRALPNKMSDISRRQG